MGGSTLRRGGGSPLPHHPSSANRGCTSNSSFTFLSILVSKGKLCQSVDRIFIYFSELRCGKTMVAYTKPQQRKKEESERLRGERDQIKFIDCRFERWQIAGLSELC